MLNTVSGLSVASERGVGDVLLLAGKEVVVHTSDTMCSIRACLSQVEYLH